VSIPRMRRAETRLGLLLACATCLAGASAMAQTPAPSPARALLSPIPAPDLPPSIPLGAPAAKGGPGEQWELFHGERIIRNVTSATLTPILPNPGRATGAAVIVAPGGGFVMLSIDNEGYAVAHWLADHGVAAFVLKYRLRETPREPSGFFAAMSTMMSHAARSADPAIETPPAAVADAQAAVRLVRARAGSFGVDPARIGFVGFSAGAMTALALALNDDKADRPDFFASIYGPMGPRTVPADAPAAFLAVALDDPLMARGKSLGLIDSWRASGRPVEVHLYQQGGHGFGMSHIKAAPALWIEEFYAWMKDRGVLGAAR
jgi:acetyl esterase/lipase